MSSLCLVGHMVGYPEESDIPRSRISRGVGYPEESDIPRSRISRGVGYPEVDEGYFVHFFAPEDLPQLKKHIVFVLDYSGSMGGRKLEQLKEAMDKILSDLSPKDHFSIVVFQSYVEHVVFTGLVSNSNVQFSKPEIIRNTTLDKRFVIEATPENIASARAYLENYSDLGATNIMGGLRTGLELVSIGSDLWSNESDPPQPVVVFLTDGEPNVEEYNTDAIINKTKPLNTKDCPIFSLAFGYGADFNFLRKLSLSNYGFARNIYEAADATDQLKNFYKTISSPLLSNVTFTYLPGQEWRWKMSCDSVTEFDLEASSTIY
ncbi:hyaluronan metabolic process [Homalodisca vitripennis]|nr:hyaluronan metabolic process [Homalodisca vitripennis]